MDLLDNNIATQALNEVGIDRGTLRDFTDIIFELEHDDEPLEAQNIRMQFAPFMEKVLQLRGGNNATVKDIEFLRRYTNVKFKAFQDVLKASHMELARVRLVMQNQNVNQAPRQVAWTTSSLGDGREEKKAETSLQQELASQEAAISLQQMLAAQFGRDWNGSSSCA